MSEALTFNILYAGYLLATLVCAFTLFATSRKTLYLRRGVVATVFAWHTIVIIQRWVVAGRPPMSNMFETLILFGWALTLAYMVVEVKYDLRILGAPASLASLLTLAYATLVFPNTVQPLMPALQNSFWLTTHVSLCFVGYGALAVAYLMCLIVLWHRTDWHRTAASFVGALSLAVIVGGLVLVRLQRAEVLSLSLSIGSALTVTAGMLAAAGVLTPALGLLVRSLNLNAGGATTDVLNRALYRTIVLGFLFLSVGIITGSVWAQQAWGRYWGWDPKETWSFITWLIYGIYLHVRFGWKKTGVLSIWLAILGFWAVVFTYFGVNFLLSGLHSYA